MTSVVAAHNTAISSASLRHWLLAQVAPFWAERSSAASGGFYDTLVLSGHADTANPTRSILTQARLTYVFSHAWQLSDDAAVRATMRTAALHGWHFMQRIDSKDGWPHTCDADGRAIDNTRDAYDHAFVLFACAWYYRASADPAALRMAHTTYDFMQAALADRLHGGFFEAAGNRTAQRRQNPHMHLLEALQALYASTGDALWQRRAEQILDLFERYFLDRDSGSLVEYFTPDWRIASGAAGQLREPGHQFEWVWLLHEAARHRSSHQQAQHSADAQRLFAFGSQYGIDRQAPLAGIVLDGVDIDGNIVIDSKLLWPQTEYIKACLSRWEWLDDRAALDAALMHITRMRQHFFLSDQANWHHQLTRDGQPLHASTPSRVLYHLFLSIAETIRVLESKAAT